MADPLRKLADSEAVVAFPEQLLPGSFVKLDHHPSDLPAFELIRCQGRRSNREAGAALDWATLLRGEGGLRCGSELAVEHAQRAPGAPGAQRRAAQ